MTITISSITRKSLWHNQIFKFNWIIKKLWPLFLIFFSVFTSSCGTPTIRYYNAPETPPPGKALIVLDRSDETIGGGVEIQVIDSFGVFDGTGFPEKKNYSPIEKLKYKISAGLPGITDVEITYRYILYGVKVGELGKGGTISWLRSPGMAEIALIANGFTWPDDTLLVRRSFRVEAGDVLRLTVRGISLHRGTIASAIFCTFKEINDGNCKRRFGK